MGHAFSHQAMAAWRWYNYVSGQVPPGKQVLRLNLDETSVCLFQGGGRGNVFVSSKRRLTQHAPRSVRRCCLTHVGVICDQTDIQPLLPQVIIGNEATFQARAVAALRRACPPNVTLLRQKSAWNNNAVCAWIVRRIGRALAPYSGRYQPVLLMDACKCHLPRNVLLACHQVGIWVVIVPALLTWLIQPLDTHGFQRYKAHLQEKYQEARIRGGGGVLSIADFLPCVYSAVRNVLQGTRWSAAFTDDGFGDHPAGISSRVLVKFNDADRPSAPLSRPTDEELALCFPRRARVPVALLWRAFDVPRPPPGPPGLRAPHARAAAAPSCAWGPVPAGGALAATREPRTRGEHRAAASSGAASSSSAVPIALRAPLLD